MQEDIADKKKGNEVFLEQEPIMVLEVSINNLPIKFEAYTEDEEDG